MHRYCGCKHHTLTVSQFCPLQLLHKQHLLCTGGEGVGPSLSPQGVLGGDGEVKTGRLILADHCLVLGHENFQSLQVILEQLNVQILPGIGGWGWVGLGLAQTPHGLHWVCVCAHVCNDAY